MPGYHDDDSDHSDSDDSNSENDSDGDSDNYSHNNSRSDYSSNDENENGSRSHHSSGSDTHSDRSSENRDRWGGKGRGDEESGWRENSRSGASTHSLSDIDSDSDSECSSISEFRQRRIEAKKRRILAICLTVLLCVILLGGTFGLIIVIGSMQSGSGEKTSTAGGMTSSPGFPGSAGFPGQPEPTPPPTKKAKSKTKTTEPEDVATQSPTAPATPTEAPTRIILTGETGDFVGDDDFFNDDDADEDETAIPENVAVLPNGDTYVLTLPENTILLQEAGAAPDDFGVSNSLLIQNRNSIYESLADIDDLNANLGKDDIILDKMTDDAWFGNMTDDALFGNMTDDALFGNMTDDALFGNMTDDEWFGNTTDDTLFPNSTENDEVNIEVDENIFSGPAENVTLANATSYALMNFYMGNYPWYERNSDLMGYVVTALVCLEHVPTSDEEDPWGNPQFNDEGESMGKVFSICRLKNSVQIGTESIVEDGKVGTGQDVESIPSEIADYRMPQDCMGGEYEDFTVYPSDTTVCVDVSEFVQKYSPFVREETEDETLLIRNLQDCADDPDFRLRDDAGCEWAAMNKEARCRKRGVTEACRATCGGCAVETSAPDQTSAPDETSAPVDVNEIATGMPSALEDDETADEIVPDKVGDADTIVDASNYKNILFMIANVRQDQDASAKFYSRQSVVNSTALFLNLELRDPTVSPTAYPSEFPSVSPTRVTQVPTLSLAPSVSPTGYPSQPPTVSLAPSVSPTWALSLLPTASLAPSVSPTTAPTQLPTVSLAPSVSPTTAPTQLPTVSSAPSVSATTAPTQLPTVSSAPSISLMPTIEGAHSACGVCGYFSTPGLGDELVRLPPLFEMPRGQSKTTCSELEEWCQMGYCSELLCQYLHRSVGGRTCGCNDSGSPAIPGDEETPVSNEETNGTSEVTDGILDDESTTNGAFAPGDEEAPLSNEQTNGNTEVTEGIADDESITSSENMNNNNIFAPDDEETSFSNKETNGSPEMTEGIADNESTTVSESKNNNNIFAPGNEETPISNDNAFDDDEDEAFDDDNDNADGIEDDASTKDFEDDDDDDDDDEISEDSRSFDMFEATMVSSTQTPTVFPTSFPTLDPTSVRQTNPPTVKLTSANMLQTLAASDFLPEQETLALSRRKPAPKHQSEPKPLAAPKPQSAPKYLAAPKTLAAPKPQSSPKYLSEPKTLAAPKPQSAPKYLTAPKTPTLVAQPPTDAPLLLDHSVKSPAPTESAQFTPCGVCGDFPSLEPLNDVMITISSDVDLPDIIGGEASCRELERLCLSGYCTPELCGLLQSESDFCGCPVPVHQPCSVCKDENDILVSPESMVFLDEYQSPVGKAMLMTCSSLEENCQAGFCEPSVCESAQNDGECDCTQPYSVGTPILQPISPAPTGTLPPTLVSPRYPERIRPPTETPSVSMSPTISPAPTHEAQFTPCGVCGNFRSLVPLNDLIITVPLDIAPPQVKDGKATCSQIDTLCLQGHCTQELCSALRSNSEFCGCPAPIHETCRVCTNENEALISPDTMIELNKYQSPTGKETEMTCFSLEENCKAGFCSPSVCKSAQNDNRCGCKLTSPPTSAPTMSLSPTISPAPTHKAIFKRCSICGGDPIDFPLKEILVSVPTEIAPLPIKNQRATCNELESYCETGYCDSTMCSSFQLSIADLCGCNAFDDDEISTENEKTDADLISTDSESVDSNESELDAASSDEEISSEEYESISNSESEDSNESNFDSVSDDVEIAFEIDSNITNYESIDSNESSFDSASSDEDIASEDDAGTEDPESVDSNDAPVHSDGEIYSANNETNGFEDDSDTIDSENLDSDENKDFASNDETIFTANEETDVIKDNDNTYSESDFGCEDSNDDSTFSNVVIDTANGENDVESASTADVVENDTDTDEPNSIIIDGDFHAEQNPESDTDAVFSEIKLFRKKEKRRRRKREKKQRRRCSQTSSNSINGAEDKNEDIQQDDVNIPNMIGEEIVIDALIGDEDVTEVDTPSNDEDVHQDDANIPDTVTDASTGNEDVAGANTANNGEGVHHDDANIPGVVGEETVANASTKDEDVVEPDTVGDGIIIGDDSGITEYIPMEGVTPVSRNKFRHGDNIFLN